MNYGIAELDELNGRSLTLTQEAAAKAYDKAVADSAKKEERKEFWSNIGKQFVDSANVSAGDDGFKFSWGKTKPQEKVTVQVVEKGGSAGGMNPKILIPIGIAAIGVFILAKGLKK